MALQSLTLHNFRSYSEASFEFSDGVNIIIGPNAIGKTNLLEAIYISSLGKGFRTKKDSELIRGGEEWARIDTVWDGQEKSVLLEKPSELLRLKKTFIFGGNKKSRLKFDDLQPLVLFQPDDLRLMSGSPGRRRDYLDTLLSQLIPSYRLDILSYERILLQRNSFLKSMGPRSSDQLFVWNMQLAERGGRIVKRRLELIETINKKISTIYSSVAGSKHSLTFHYEGSVPGSYDSNSLLQALEASIARDQARGFTGVGPHRDNVTALIDGKQFKEVASRGENRTLVLALKILELEEIKNRRQVLPCLLLDDVFSELDGQRRRLLTNYLKNHQTFITTTDADVIEKDFSQKATIIGLSNS